MRRGSHPRRLATAGTVILAGLIVAGTPGSLAQSPPPPIIVEGPDDSPEPSRQPGIAEVALCEMPELGLPAGGTRPGSTVAQRGQTASVGSTGHGRLLQGGVGSDGRCRIAAADDFQPVYGTLDPARAFEWQDPSGDGARPATDITELYFGAVMLSDADVKKARKDKGLVSKGPASKAVRKGAYRVVEATTSESFGTQSDANVSLLVITDADGDGANNVASSVATNGSPLVGGQQVYSFAFPSDGRDGQAYSTDFATGGWYEDSQPWFAVPGPGGVFQIYIPDKGVGDSLVVAAHADGEGGGYDIASLGPPNRPLPVDGIAWGLPFFGCLENEVIHQPLRVEEMLVDLEALDALEAPSQKVIWACFRPTDAELDLLAGLMEDAPDDVVGRVTVTFTVGDHEVTELVPLRAVPDPLADRVYIGLTIGLIQYGRYDITDMRPLPTGDPARDAILGNFVTAVWEAEEPFTVDESEGFLAGDGTCRAAEAA